MTVKKILDLARSQIGTKATNIKKCEYNDWYYGYSVSGADYDWCETFIQWLFGQLDSKELLYTTTANCGVQGRAFYDNGKLIKSGFKAGDIVFFHWSNEMSSYVPGCYSLDHVGIIESVNSDGSLNTIEGNTGSTYNGEVMRRTRSLSVVSCAGRPSYDGSDPPTPPSGNIPDVFYRVRTDGRWLKEVNNLSSFAGLEGHPITDIAIGVSSGRVKYRVHIKGGDWLPYVEGYDIYDDENGYAGDKKAIDLIEVYYYTSSDFYSKNGYYLRAKYRVSPLDDDYYDWQYDDETSNGQDGFAGDYGDELDRVQIELVK